MRIAGLNKTTLLDYPGHVAAAVFTAGCNFRCPFCHNKDLITGQNIPMISQEEVLAFLEGRRKVLAGVCITGGEPTLQSDLRDFLYKIKQLGYLIKLDTNGYRPGILKKLIEEKLLDYIAMDIKNSKAKYPQTCGYPDLDIDKIEESMSVIKSSGISYEFRTTVVKELHTEEDLLEIGRKITGEGKYFLQGYEENENVMQKGFHAYKAEELRAFGSKLTRMGAETYLRGME